MEGLFAVIFVIIGIVNFVMKQQEQDHRQGGMRSYKPQPPRKPVMDRKSAVQMKDFRNEGIKEVVEGEGFEAEDRSRTGSLDYIEQSQSREGECDEHPEHRQKLKREQQKKPAPRLEVLETEHDGIAIELTEEHLLSSFIMSEIIGPPRALKRSIR